MGSVIVCLAIAALLLLSNDGSTTEYLLLFMWEICAKTYVTSEIHFISYSFPSLCVWDDYKNW